MCLYAHDIQIRKTIVGGFSSIVISAVAVAYRENKDTSALCNNEQVHDLLSSLFAENETLEFNLRKYVYGDSGHWDAGGFSTVPTKGNVVSKCTPRTSTYINR